MRRIMVTAMYLSFLVLCPKVHGQVPTDRPIRVCMLADYSGSMKNTPLPTLDHLKPITDYIQEFSGEVSFLAITENSNAPLYRYYVPDFSPPVKPDLSGMNGKERIKATNRYNNTVMRYMTARDKRAERAARELAVFQESVKPVIEQPANRPGTDIWGALWRCTTMLREETTFKNKHHDYVVIITDAQHTTSTSEVKTLPANVSLYLVYNSMQISDFGNYRFQQFESINASIRALLAHAGQGRVAK